MTATGAAPAITVANERNASRAPGDQAEVAIAADPHDVQPYADLALLQIMRRDRAAALQTIDRMAAANPSRDTVLFAADSLDRWGEHEAAAKWRAKAR